MKYPAWMYPVKDKSDCPGCGRDSCTGCDGPKQVELVPVKKGKK